MKKNTVICMLIGLTYRCLKNFLTFLSTFFIFSVGISQNITSLKPSFNGNVGDIYFNPALDKRNFFLCDSLKIYQYSAVGGGYEGGRRRIKDEFKKNIETLNFFKNSNTDGYVTIRFIVNCKGEIDRFRILQVDKNYKTTTFDSSAIDTMLKFVKQLKGWKKIAYEGNPLDYYQYLTFIIRDGKVNDIMP